jgi:two-component system response regulator YesN
VKDLQDWVRDVLEKALFHIGGLDSSETVVERIKRYIALFKKEVSMTPQEYRKG